MTVTEIVLTQMFFLIIGSKEKNKNESTEYHSIFMQYKSQVCPSQESAIFLLFGS